MYTKEGNWASLLLRRFFTKCLLLRAKKALKYDAIGKELRMCHGNVAREYSAQVWMVQRLKEWREWGRGRQVSQDSTEMPEGEKQWLDSCHGRQH